jgi:hypothetical protein
MATKRSQAAVPPPPPVASGADQAALASAYKGGLILGWRLESPRGYRLTLRDQRDDYVEVAGLMGYLDKLGKTRS